MKIPYKKFNFRQKTLDKIETANNIIEEYQEDGYELTLRQLYYQFVSRDLIENKQSEYKTLGDIVNNARLAGLIDWDAIVDRTRKIVEWDSHENPSAAIDDLADRYAIDTREGQLVYIEAWIEKEALAGVLERAAMKADIPYFSCRGYVSQSAMWRASQRILNKLCDYERCVILHLGDHDPSGIDMTRDIRDRLEMFGDGADIEVDRIALNMDQIKRLNPPPNPARITDSRYQKYRVEFGDESWELDALEPKVITGLIGKNVDLLTDGQLRQDRLLLQRDQRSKLREIAEGYESL